MYEKIYKLLDDMERTYVYAGYTKLSPGVDVAYESGWRGGIVGGVRLVREELTKRIEAENKAKEDL